MFLDLLGLAIVVEWFTSFIDSLNRSCGFPLLFFIFFVSRIKQKIGLKKNEKEELVLFLNSNISCL